MSFAEFLSILLSTIATCVAAGVSFHKEMRERKAAREADATKKDDDRQSGPKETIIILVVIQR
jgi:hypothetical protein